MAIFLDFLSTNGCIIFIQVKVASAGIHDRNVIHGRDTKTSSTSTDETNTVNSNVSI